jgi:hypothetical protein
MVELAVQVVLAVEAQATKQPQAMELQIQAEAVEAQVILELREEQVVQEL